MRVKEGMKENIERRFISERELSTYSGIAVRTLQNWRLRGYGPPYKKLGGAARYDILAFDAWANSCPGGGESNSPGGRIAQG